MIPLKDETPVRSTPFVTRGMVILNTVLFLAAAGSGLQSVVERYGAVPALISDPSLSEQKVVTVTQERVIRGFFGEEYTETVSRKVSVPRQPIPPLLTLLTSMFIHGGLFHLLGNMWFLWIFGDNVEDLVGHGRFVVFYLLCGVAASLSHVLIQPDVVLPMVGASGAISGVMGAYLRKFPMARIVTLLPIFFFFHLIRVPAFLFLGVWFLLQLLSAGGEQGVAWYAHIGGFVVGFLLIGLMARRTVGYGRIEAS